MARPAVVLALGVVGGLGASLVLAGCTGEEPVAPEPSTSSVETEPAETAEPSPTETGPPAPERPAAMERDDAEGAAAAAVYFIELYDYVMTTGDTAEWEAMSHESCEWCATSIKQAKTIAERGDQYSSDGIDAAISDPYFYVRDEATGIFPLDVEMAEAATTITDVDGKELYAAPASVQTNRVEVGLQKGLWVIVEIAAID